MEKIQISSKRHPHVAVVNEDSTQTATQTLEDIPIEDPQEDAIPIAIDVLEKPKPLTLEQIAYQQKQLRIKALKFDKQHKDATIKHVKHKATKVARRNNRT